MRINYLKCTRIILFIFKNDVVLQSSFLGMSLSGFGMRTILAFWNDLGNGHSHIFVKGLCRIISSVGKLESIQVSPHSPWAFFWEDIKC
jgi:hypothetical protein